MPDPSALIADAWLHDLSPFVLRIRGEFGIRWYGLAYVLGFVFAWWAMARMARARLLALREAFVGDAILAIVLGTVVGGRLGYVLFYRPSLLWTFDGTLPFWGLLAINEGGMASHGGMLGLVAAAWWIARRENLPLRHVTDAICLVAPVGILLGRLANFVNGELLGKVVALPGEAAPWWSVRFPQELGERLTAEQAAMLSVRGFSPAQAIEGVQRGDASIIELVEPMLHARHASQLYQAFAEGLLLLIVVWLLIRRVRTPGVVTAWFVIVYGIGRIATEFVRLPDGHFDAGSERPLGLSRGQWLSIGMIAIGLLMLVWNARRQRAARAEERARFGVGGWGVARDKRTKTPEPINDPGAPDESSSDA
ncbi:MAG: prolipoprotein diacylglyceryl transferase [Planctomycetota bacterium]